MQQWRHLHWQSQRVPVHLRRRLGGWPLRDQWVELFVSWPRNKPIAPNPYFNIKKKKKNQFDVPHINHSPIWCLHQTLMTAAPTPVIMEGHVETWWLISSASARMAGRERRATPVRALFFLFPHPCSLSVQAHGMCLWLYIITQCSTQ